MYILKTKEEIEKMREGGRILAEILNHLAKISNPGITTKELNEEAERLIEDYEAIPAFKGVPGGKIDYPAALCASVNDQVVHGIPGEYALSDGDIIGLDLGIFYKGLCTDATITVGVGKISKEAQRLIDVTKKALDKAISIIKPGIFMGDVSSTIQKIIEDEGFSVVRDCFGHGVGKEVHEDPAIPNFGIAGEGLRLKEGMTLALEPIANLGRPETQDLDDGWTISTLDGSISSEFEHTIAITEKGAEILTTVRQKGC